MDLNYLRTYCLSKPGTEETFPFDEYTLVIKVMGKAFFLADIRREEKAVNLKCDPEKAIELRASHEEVQPGYHMNKKHWNTVLTEGNLEESLILHLIDHSYDMVIKGLPKKLREQLNSL
jgi:predicted DNA-binding protein (MmcQ/YjbR family)